MKKRELIVLFVSVFFVCLLSVSVRADTEVSLCGKLSTAGETYVLNQSIINNSLTTPCLNITTENITLNCAGFYILSDDIRAGVYSNKLNTTIKNCNITMSTSTGGIGIHLIGANKSYIYNNTLKSNYGLSITGTSEVIIDSLISNSNQNAGIYLSSSNNNNLSNITSNNNIKYGILTTTSSNNLILDSIFNNNLENGVLIRVQPADNNTLINITANNNTFSGIDMQLSSNNLFFNITSSFNQLDGIRFTGGSYNVINTLTANNNTFYGINIGACSNNNLTDITSNDNLDTGVYINDGSDNNLFKNLLLNSTTFDVYIALSSNNIFLNSSYDLLKEFVTADSSDLIRKWYYKAYLEDAAGSVIDGVNITSYNNSDAYNFNLTTGANGYTNLGEIIDYTNIGGEITYYSNYTIYAQKAGYTTLSHSFNASLGNSYNDSFILQVSAATTTPTEETTSGGITSIEGEDIIFRQKEISIAQKGSYVLIRNSILNFSFDNVNHSAKIIEVGKDYVVIEVKSEKQQVKINVGEEKEVDLNGDSINDIKIKLEKISYNAYASLSFSSIEKSGEQEKEEIKEQKKYSFYYLFVLVFILIAILILMLVIKIKNRIKKSK